MKPSQYRPDVGDSGPLSRSTGQHVPSGGHPVYLAQHHPSFASQAAGASPHAPRDYHPHHLQTSDLSHLSHVPGLGSIGIGPGHVPMHMPQRRRTSGHRLSLLRDIGVAGERERDRSESGSSGLPHTYTSTVAGSSHIIPGPVLYGGRPTMTMMSSLGGLQASQKNLSGSSQPPGGTPPRHNQSASGSLGRQSTSVHPYSAGAGSFMLPGPSVVKSEPGISSFVKEESKSPLHSMGAHYSLLHSQPYHPPQHPATPVKSDQQEKEAENMPSKEFLLQSMDKVDKEMSKVSSEIKGLERKKQQLESAAKQPPQAEKSTSPKKVETKHKDLWQVIYAENKRKAEAARGLLDQLCPRYDMPLYNQPSDTKVYQENLKKNEVMRPKLLAYFQRKCQLSNIRERYLCTRYDQLMTEWQKKIEKEENCPKRQANEAKFRDYFEKQFPEIRKQREQQERFSRSGTRGDACRSDADFHEIVDGLTEQENQEQHMRQLAVVPPMLLDRDQRRFIFINNNGLVSDPMEDYKKRQELDNWSAQEKQIFREKYVQHPKNFHAIASFLEKKTVADCVLFYYLSKKSVGYKQLVRKNSLKPRKVKSGRGHAQQSSTSGSAQDANKTLQDVKNQGDKDSEQKRDSPIAVVKEEEIERTDRPPSPRMTRSRNKNLNWTDEDISIAKDGFVKYGKDYAAISRLFSNKTENQIKNFYNNYKKKHNLDQLILDGKKKKPEGTRRTRTQAQTTEPTSITPPIEEAAATGDESRPKSTDPQDLEPSDTSKKRKKDNDVDKKDDQKTEATGGSPPPEGDSSSAPSRIASSQIRTRRSGQNTKRTSESPPADEPAEKKAKKVKLSKEAKTESKETAPEEAQTTQQEKQETQKLEESKTTESQPSTEKQQVKLDEKKSDLATEPVAAPSEVLSTTTTTPATSEQEKLVKPVVSSAPAAVPMASSVVSQPTVPEVTVQPAKEVSQPLQKKHDNDGDSSATCSADEDTNMPDVESKPAENRKHADSPYAFEDDSSASIKLESSRKPTPPLSNFATMKQPLPAKTPPAIIVRPASTHPPQPIGTKPDEKRPQSVPPPPGAIGCGSVPISALTFNPNIKPVHADLRPNSTPTIAQAYHPPTSHTAGLKHPSFFSSPDYSATGHIVGKVPDADEFRNALTASLMLPQTSEKMRKPPMSEPCQTIDLTVPSSSTDSPMEEPSKGKDAMLTPPHLLQERMSMQKDFSGRKPDMIPIQEAPIQRPYEYNPAQIAMMKERTPVIPVNALRAPVLGTSQRKGPLKIETLVKKENPASVIDVGMPPKPYMSQLGHQPWMTSPVRPQLTTSSIATKVVYGSMTSGAPIRQNPQVKPPLPSSVTDTRRSDVIATTHSTHRPPDPGHLRRSPSMEAASSRGYPYVIRPARPPTRESIVKSTGLEPPAHIKQLPGSIMSGLPIHRGHEERVEHRTETIAGKQVVVNKPYPRASPINDPIRIQEERMHGLRYPQPGVHHPGLPQKGTPGTGSIIDGTPVKRKHSDESNSSLSPSTNPPHSSVVASQPSHPTAPPIKQNPDQGRLDKAAEELRNAHAQYQLLLAGKAKEKEMYARQAQEKLMREQQQLRAGTVSPAHRHNPTSSMPQRPTIKQEHPGSPHTAEELMRKAQHPQLPISLLDLHAAVTANPEFARLPVGMPHISLTAPGVSPDLLEIWRQYGRAGGVSGPAVYPFLVPSGIPHGYGGFPVHGLNPTAAPGSPHNEDRENRLSQDFKTAQLMFRLKQPAPATVPGAPGVLPGTVTALTAPGMPPLVVSAPSPYHPLGAPYHAAGLSVDNILMQSHPGLPRSPFPQQFPTQSGRSSTDITRSPTQKTPKPESPEMRQRHRSSETSREFSNHPAIKGRNSPSSPYHSPRGNVSPQLYHTPKQLSPSHIPPTKVPRGIVHPGASPAHLPHPHRQLASSPHISAPHPYPGQDPQLQESRPMYGVKHSRSGSLDVPMQPRFERSRPESAGPRSLPQSPNDPSLTRYGQRPEAKPPQLVSHESKPHFSRDERQPSPRPGHKLSGDRGDHRIMSQPPVLVSGTYQPPTAGQMQRRESPSPYQQPKDRPESASSKERPPSRPDLKPPLRQDTPRMPHIVSSNPREDLKKIGRTKMKAATLIDQIIMTNYDSTERTPSPRNVPQTGPPIHTKQPSDAGRMSERSERNVGESAPPKALYETEGRQQYTPAHAYPMSQLSQPSSGPPPLAKEKSSAQQPPVHGVTFLKHSQNVIEEIYRKNHPETKPTPAQASSSLPPRSTVMVTEPISPPEKRLTSGRSEPSQPPPTVLSQVHQPPRYPVMHPEQKPRHEPPSEPPRPPVSALRPAAPPTTIPIAPQSRAPTASGLLEDIIRKALNPESSTAMSQEVGQADKRSGGMRFTPDMMISHAAMSMLPHVLATASPSPNQETRKTTPATSQSNQSGSGPYMSALMIKAGPPQNVPQPAQTDRTQQFYPRPQSSASQSPAPQESNSQARQTLLRPQYEALSDSDD